MDDKAPQTEDKENSMPDADNEQDNAEELPTENSASSENMTAPAAGGATAVSPNDEMPPATTAMTLSNQDKLEKLTFLKDLSQDAIYLMGLSFILGVLFTVFVLLVLDFMRRNNDPAIR